MKKIIVEDWHGKHYFNSFNDVWLYLDIKSEKLIREIRQGMREDNYFQIYRGQECIEIYR